MIYVSFTLMSSISLFIWILYRFILFRKRNNFNIIKEVILGIFFIYFLIVLKITIFKMGNISFINPFVGHRYGTLINIIPLKETVTTLLDSSIPIVHPIRNILGNIFLFLPLGFFIPLLFNNYYNIFKILLLGFISSLSIEIIQIFTLGNISDIDDVIFNTIGVVIGFGIYSVLKYIILKYKNINFLDGRLKQKTNFRLDKIGIPVVIVSISTFGAYSYSIHDQTFSADLSDDEIAKEVFNFNLPKLELTRDICDYYKAYLSVDIDNYISIDLLKKFNKNRYIYSNSYGSYINNHSMYNIEFIEDDRCGTNLIIYGKNDNIDKVLINFNGKQHKEKIRFNEFFLVSFPTFEQIPHNNDIYNILEGKKSKYLDIQFLDRDGNVLNIEKAS